MHLMTVESYFYPNQSYDDKYVSNLIVVNLSMDINDCKTQFRWSFNRKQRQNANLKSILPSGGTIFWFKI